MMGRRKSSRALSSHDNVSPLLSNLSILAGTHARRPDRLSLGGCSIESRLFGDGDDGASDTADTADATVDWA